MCHVFIILKKIQIGYYVNTSLSHLEHKLTDINRLIEG